MISWADFWRPQHSSGNCLALWHDTSSGLGDRIGVFPMLELGACFNILAGILAFFLIRTGNKTQPEPKREVIAQSELLEPDTVAL